MPHETDAFRFPVDPQLRRLENHLGDLAGMWRGTGNLNIVKEYNVILNLMYDLGWDGLLDIESQLPEDLMNQEYLKRHPGPLQWA